MAGMGSLYTGLSGIQAGQNALNTTAHNLANVNTTGYVRQQVLQGDAEYFRAGEASISRMQAGIGVTTEDIRQVRDFFLDKAYRTESGRQSFYETGYSVIEEVETLFGELEGVAFQGAMTDLRNAISELAKDPASTVNRSLLKQKAVAFIERAAAVTEGLSFYQENLDVQAKETIARINELGSTINSLNGQILKIEAGRVENANDLRDARNSALDELSTLIKTEYKEDENGLVTVNAEGVQFVTKDSVYMMEAAEDPATGFVEPTWPHLKGAGVFDFESGCFSGNNSDIGGLKSLILARGIQEGNYTDIPAAPDRADYASGEEYDAALTQYTKDRDYYNSSVEASILMNTMAEFDQLIHGIVTGINDILCPNTEIEGTIDGVTGTFTVLDEAKASYESDGTVMGTELFSRNGVDRYQLKSMTMPDGTTREVYLYKQEDRSDIPSLYSVKNLEVNPVVLKDAGKLPLTTAEGDVDYDKAGALEDIWRKDFASLNPNTQVVNNFGTYYNSLISAIANEGSVYRSVSEAERTTTQELQNQRQSVAGVSSDEELANMIKYQNAYNASSRYMNVVSEMLEQIVSSLGA